MINYVEKGWGLHKAVAAAGHWLEQHGTVWRSSDDAVVQAIIDAYPLSSYQAEVCAAVDARANALREKAVAGKHFAEVASWPLKATEADRINKGGAPNAAYPILSAEATAAGESLQAIAGRVLANSAAFSTLEGSIAGAARKHRAAITALTTFAAVTAYDYTTGWPSV